MKAWLFLHEVEEADGPVHLFARLAQPQPPPRGLGAPPGAEGLRQDQPQEGRRLPLDQDRAPADGLSQGREVRRARQHLRRSPTPTASTPAASPSALGAGGDLGLFAPQPLRAVDRPGPRLPPAARHRQAVIAWWFMELRQRLGRATPRWRHAGVTRPGAPPQPWPEPAPEPALRRPDAGS